MIEKSLFKFCGSAKKYIYQGVIINSIRLFANILFSVSFASLISRFFFDFEIISVKIAIISIIISLIVRHICIKLYSKKSDMLVNEVKVNLRNAIYKKVLSIGMAYQEVMTTQEIVHLGVEGVEQLENYYGLYLIQFYYSFVSAWILFLFIMPISIKVALVLLILSPVIPAFLLLILKIVKNVQRKYWSKYADVGNLFLDSLQGMTTLKVFKADEYRAKEIDEMSEGFRKETMRVLSMQLNSIMIIDWIAYGGAVLAIIMVLFEYKSGNLNIYEMILILMLIADYFVPMRLLTSYFHIAMTGVSASERMLDFLNREGKISYGEQKYTSNCHIKIDNLNYYYPDGTHALKNMSMEFKNASFTAIVGESGCGKSTLASLISAEYIASEKSIFYGSNDLFMMRKGEINKNVIRITHDGHIFSGTVRDNLSIGKSNASDEEMIEVLKKVNLWKTFYAISGLDSEILSQGKNLSGGQAQRLSLARALLHDAEVYIFDEATSNIDIESEEIILSIIEELSTKKTVIYISHRLSSAKNADCIYVLDKGELVEKGKHKELMELNSVYKSLFTQQESLEKYRLNKSFLEESKEFTNSRLNKEVKNEA